MQLTAAACITTPSRCRNADDAVIRSETSILNSRCTVRDDIQHQHAWQREPHTAYIVHVIHSFILFDSDSMAHRTQEHIHKNKTQKR